MVDDFKIIIDNQRILIEKFRKKIGDKQKEIVNLQGEISFADRTINKLKNVLAGSNLSVRDFNLVTEIVDDYYKGKK